MVLKAGLGHDRLATWNGLVPELHHTTHRHNTRLLLPQYLRPQRCECLLRTRNVRRLKAGACLHPKIPGNYGSPAPINYYRPCDARPDKET